MKHILHVIQSLEFGGAEKVVVHLANKFSGDYKVSVCTTKTTGELAAELNDSIKLILLESGEGNNPKLISDLKQLIIDNNIDIVHCHDWGVYVESVLATKRSGRAKVVLTVHGPYTQYEPGFKSKLKIFLRHVVERYLSKYTFKIVAVSNAIKQYIEKDIGIKKDKVKVIHNGFSGYEISEQPDRDSCRKLITVGRVAKVKNHRLMIDAFAKSSETNPDLSLTIVGDGPEFADLQQYVIDSGLESKINLTGFRTDIEELLRSHDAFLLSSQYEGISIAGLEAMSLGMPVISTKVGGIPEMVIHNNNGLLVENENIAEYTKAINTLYSDDQLFQNMKTESRKLFLEQFQENNVLHEYRLLYDQI